MSTAETRREHIEVWQSNGMTQCAYCRAHGLNAKTFGSRVRAYRGVQCSRSVSMIPVTITPMSSPVDVLRLRGHGDHVLELPPTVAPHWLWELLKYTWTNAQRPSKFYLAPRNSMNHLN